MSNRLAKDLKPQYTYRAKVLSVYDADTIRCDIDLGMKTWVHNEPIRLARINAPEVRGEEREDGLESRDVLREWILDREIILTTEKDDKGKYGRYVAEVWLQANGEWMNVNDRLVAAGLAQYKHY